MEEVIGSGLGILLRVIGFIAIECMFYELFYYIGAVPVWIVTGGRLPTRAIHKLDRTNRTLYGVIGVMVSLTLLCCI